MTAYWCASAWLPDGVVNGVLVTESSGKITSVSVVDRAPAGAVVLPGLVFPGFANAHSHAFHRALRGRTHGGGGTFWTWRDRMYELAGRLDPDSYLELARAAYAEMALAGVTCVGEFHYVHHAPGGARYDNPNAMGHALAQAARDAGIRITLLDTCYLAGGIGEPISSDQQRFSDGDADAWASRVAELRPDDGFRIGAAIHSVRAVPRAELSTVAAFDGPLHVHLSEQPAENEACLAAYSLSPTQLLAEAGALGPRTTAVHATHLTPQDIALLGGSGTGACFCPTTEADLADGIGPARELVDAGSPLSLGSDQHAVVDPLAEARALEHGERLRTGKRGRFAPAELVAALTAHRALGWPEAGRIEVGAPADLVAVRTDTVRTAGSLAEQIVLTASASDVDTVVVGGRVVVRSGEHVLGDVGGLLTKAIERAWA
ncbi:formimidoylglutamate deiminase [Actinokineospora sp. NBRC 105648]|uniref:formimidoylglutamate deiminase n=1 Tax=Actinokineospora sp. NBRC 105648 TaxID=3032206 RepID=UPI0024A4082F|nr:formimidoylglutamate deiminase [Actinokineospora sp. NBRC 105648]GLZ38419.1 formimidoylglutamate deiminase [Actinokineospora sp. NBRC 105648]